MQPHYIARKSTKLTGVVAADGSNSGPDTSRNTNGAPPRGRAPVWESPLKVRGSKVPHVDPDRPPLNPRHRPRTRGPALTDGQSQRVGVGPGSRAPNPAVAVSTAGRSDGTQGTDPSSDPHSHRPWSGVVPGCRWMSDQGARVGEVKREGVGTAERTLESHDWPSAGGCDKQKVPFPNRASFQTTVSYSIGVHSQVSNVVHAKALVGRGDDTLRG